MHFLAFVTIINHVLYDVKIFMKKVFVWIWQMALKHRKHLFYGILVLFVGQICFFNFGGIWVENYVLADGGDQTQNDVIQEKSTEWYAKFSFLYKMVYVLIYPILIVAAKLVDNSLVYWEIFWFDAVLWQLWNIVKNLANYSLWFIFVYKIFEFLLKWQKTWEVKKILVSSLIAWIGIQASWFLMAALIDISTILTYWVGWLPISVLKDSGDDVNDPENLEYNPYVLKTLVSADAKDIDTIDTYLTNTEVWEIQPWVFYISECETFSYKVSSGDIRELILAPKNIYYKSLSWYESTDANRCHYYGQVYYFNVLYSDGDLNLAEFVWGNKFSPQENRSDGQNTYKSKLMDIKQKIINNTWNLVVTLISNGQILEIWDAHMTWWVLWSLWWGKYWEDQKWWLDVHNKWTGVWWQTSRLQDVLDGYSYVGVFTALYSSLLNSWKWIISSDAWTFASLLNVAMSLWYVLAIWIPLIVVAIVFMIRIWVIWLAIVLAPFIVLAEAFEDIWKKVFKWKLLEYLKLKNLIPIIFSPAIICFAISMSSVLVTIIMWFNNDEIATGGSEILWWLIKLNIGWLSLPLMKLIVSVLWVAITWFIVWAAIETTKIWESKIISSLKSLATNALWSIPIVPVVWKWVDWKPKTEFVWANAAFGDRWIIPSLSNKIKREFDDSENEFIQDFIDPDRVKWRQDDAYKNAVIGLQTVPQNWTTVGIDIPSENWKSTYKYNFSQISADKKDGIIQAINNISDASKRALFGNSQPTITFNDWEKDIKYTFNGWNDKDWKPINKYELLK